MIERERLIEEQRRIASRVVWEDDFEDIRTVGGADQAFLNDQVISAIVVLDLECNVVERTYGVVKCNFPYIPGFLAFREGDAVIHTFSLLKSKPDILMINACGVNHPRFAGLASHVGVLLNIPTIGVTKSVLCGSYRIPRKVGEICEIVYQGRVVGALMKTRESAKPIVIGPGHRVSLRTSVDLVRKFLRGHKFPEPIRLAHEFATDALKELMKT